MPHMQEQEQNPQALLVLGVSLQVKIHKFYRRFIPVRKRWLDLCLRRCFENWYQGWRWSELKKKKQGQGSWSIVRRPRGLDLGGRSERLKQLLKRERNLRANLQCQKGKIYVENYATRWRFSNRDFFLLSKKLKIGEISGEIGCWVVLDFLFLANFVKASLVHSNFCRVVFFPHFRRETRPRRRRRIEASARMNRYGSELTKKWEGVERKYKKG